MNRFIKNQVKDRYIEEQNHKMKEDLEEWVEEQLANWPSFEGKNQDLIFHFDYDTYQIVAVTGHFSFWTWRIEL